MRQEELTLTFKAKFYVDLDRYPKNWNRSQIIDAEIDNFYENPIDYLQVIIDEDEYDVTIT